MEICSVWCAVGETETDIVLCLLFAVMTAFGSFGSILNLLLSSLTLCLYSFWYTGDKDRKTQHILHSKSTVSHILERQGK